MQLPFGTSLYDLKHGHTPPAAELTERDGVRLYTPDAALTKVSESFLSRNPVEAQVVLRGIQDSSDVLRRLLDGGHSTVAGRLAGAFRKVGRDDVADDIVAAMRAAGYDVRESNPFAPHEQFGARGGASAPIVERLRVLWEACREPVIEVFPSAPGLPRDERQYLRRVDENYRSDAYHSLSIEGYRVTPEMIERVQAGDWDPDNHDADRQSRDALAARGYWQAFQLVRDDVAKIIAGCEDPAALVSASHRDWYRELFQPCVAAGLISASALAGYRSDAVFLRGSRHVPPRSEAVRDAMPTLFAIFGEESEPSVRAVLGHWLLGYIHPYPDGNGRMARFLMNAMLASGGYPWTVIRVEDRDEYLTALERASVSTDIVPFANFIAERVEHSM
jgi:fido (protein-threonine AMPylation protein)